MKLTLKTSTLIASLAALAASGSANAVTVTGGSATFTFDEDKGGPISFFDAYFNATTTFADASSAAAPGNQTFIRLTGTPGTVGTASTVGVPGTPGSVQVTDAIRAAGATLPALTRRAPQDSTLDVDLTSAATVLSSWGASSDDFGVYVGSTSKGEQIGFTGMERWGGAFTGALYYSDFGLRYVPARAGTSATGGTLSGLVLTSNIDFLNAAFADLANVTIVPNAANGTLTISGDLLTSGGLAAFGAPAGVDFGNVTINATLVPEPTSIALLGLGGVALLRRRRMGR